MTTRSDYYLRVLKMAEPVIASAKETGHVKAQGVDVAEALDAVRTAILKLESLTRAAAGARS